MLDQRIDALLDITDMSEEEYHSTVIALSDRLCREFPTALLAASSIHDNALSFSVAYDEAMATLEQQYDTCNDACAFYSKPTESNNVKLTFSGETEYKLIRWIEMGCEERGRELIHRIWQESGAAKTQKLARLLAVDMLCALQKVPQQDTDLEKKAEWVILRMRNYSSGQMLELLLEALHLACDRRIRQTMPCSTPLRDEVLGYIRTHYMNQELSAEQICRALGYSKSRVFAAFTSSDGDSLLSTISSVRVDNAKTLLRTTTLSVSEISGRVGYHNVNTFLRVFKKYESITPGQYRQMGKV